MPRIRKDSYVVIICCCARRRFIPAMQAPRDPATTYICVFCVLFLDIRYTVGRAVMPCQHIVLNFLNVHYINSWVFEILYRKFLKTTKKGLKNTQKSLGCHYRFNRFQSLLGWEWSILDIGGPKHLQAVPCADSLAILKTMKSAGTTYTFFG